MMARPHLRHLLMAAILPLMPFAGLAQDMSNASAHSSLAVSGATGQVLSGAAELLASGGQLVVRSVESVAGGVVLVLERSSETVQVSLKGTREASEREAVRVGQTIESVPDESGTAIRLEGRIIAYIPNALGRTLLHHSKITATGKVQ